MTNQTTQREPTIPYPKMHQPHVLIVDDEPLIRNLLTSYLESRDFIVTTAESGAESLRLLETLGKAVDVVLLDVQMPEMTGPETLKLLHQIRPDLPACFMSGNFGSYSAQGLLAMPGVKDLFLKPMSLNDLAERLSELAQANN